MNFLLSVVSILSFARARDHWVTVTSNGVSRPVLVHLPELCAQDTGATCAFSSCASGSECSGFEAFGSKYRCLCQDGMCAVDGKCVQAESLSLPLVVNFHPMGLKPKLWSVETGMNAVADKHRFIVAYPQGLVPAETISALIPGWPKSWLTGGYTWNAGSCCPGATRKQVDDVQFTRDMLDQLKKQLILQISNGAFSIDSRRIYACGGSNGAFLSFRIACEAPDLFAAIVPVAGVLANQTRAEYPLSDPEWPMNSFACAPRKRPLPTLIFQGDADLLVPMPGEPIMGFRSPADNVRVMKLLNNIPDESAGVVSYRYRGAECISYGDATTNVTFCKMHMMGHAWPGHTATCEATQLIPGAMCSTDADATAEAWRFFERYSLDDVSEDNFTVIV